MRSCLLLLMARALRESSDHVMLVACACTIISDIMVNISAFLLIVLFSFYCFDAKLWAKMSCLVF